MNTKKLTMLLALATMAVGAVAQNIYSLCDYHDSTGYYAGVSLNGQLLYKTASQPYSSGYAPKTVLCDANGDVYWLSSKIQWNGCSIWKNGELLCQSHSTYDIFLYQGEVLCAGYYSKPTPGGAYVPVAAVWRCSDNSIYWELGDGMHPSKITDVEVEEQTAIPYFCGEITDAKRRAVVWKGQELIYQCPDILGDEALEYSYAEEISVEGDDVYTRIKVEGESVAWCIVKNGIIVFMTDDYHILTRLCAFQGDAYYGLQNMIQNTYYLVGNHNGQEIQVLDFYADGSFFKPQKIHHFGDDLVAVGQCNGSGWMWQNGKVSSPEKSTVVYDVFIDRRSVGQEWYYEIENEDGSVTYQYLQHASDTVINNDKTKVVVRTNHIYDKMRRTEITHEYVLEAEGVVYWWNKTLGEFTELYDYNAAVGDEWEITVGTESLTMHVDAVEAIQYGDSTYRVLRVSDAGDIFSGEIVCGIGHLTSFFPERLMTKGYRVEGLRCYWIDNELILYTGDEDCDEIYERYHHGVDEPVVESIEVYPNPAGDVLFVETSNATDYRIVNLFGQTLISGTVSNSVIDISALSNGIYFLKIKNSALKIIVNH